MDYPIKNWSTGETILVAKIEAEPGTPNPVKKRLAALWAIKNGRSLNYADLSDANLNRADLSDANLSGADLNRADLGDANLNRAYLNYAYLNRAYLNRADLSGANLCGANLSGADLSVANLSGADLSGADLSDANLRDADLRDVNLRDVNLRDADLFGAKSNFNVPSVPQLHQRVYKAASKAGALDMRDWHSECGTTHCRAGWIVKIAGEGGGKLEAELGTPLTAYLIAQKSGVPVERDEFYVSNQAALECMRKAAELEAEREGRA